MSDEPGPDHCRKTALAMACIAAIKPDMSSEDDSKTLNKAFVAENPDCCPSLQVDVDVLSDVLDAGEARKIGEYAAALEKIKATKSFVMHTRDKFVLGNSSRVLALSSTLRTRRNRLAGCR